MVFNRLNEVVSTGQMEISSLKKSMEELISTIQYVKIFHSIIPELFLKPVIALQKYENNRSSVFILLHISGLLFTSQRHNSPKRNRKNTFLLII